jgi:hypothetical protein
MKQNKKLLSTPLALLCLNVFSFSQLSASNGWVDRVPVVSPSGPNALSIRETALEAQEALLLARFKNFIKGTYEESANKINYSVNVGGNYIDYRDPNTGETKRFTSQ